jgi:uncharacterized protein YkwD
VARLRQASVAALAGVCASLCAAASPALAAHHAAHHRAHTAWVCTNTQLRPTPWNLPAVRAATRCLVNRERVSRGERALTSSPLLERAAQSHTESMAFGDYFAHVGPGGDTPMARIRAAGYLYNAHVSIEVGENIAWGTLWLASPRAIVNAWMTSPEHRANILDPQFRSTAIGVSTHLSSSLGGGQSGAIYTEDFGSIPSR